MQKSTASRARPQGLDHGDGPVDGRALLVGGEQQRDRAGVARMVRDEFLGRHGKCGQRGLHVGRAAAVEAAVALGRHERVGAPLIERAGRHDVGMAGKDHGRPGGAAAQPEVAYAVAVEAFGAETAGVQAPRQQLLAAAVGGRDRGQRQQRLDQRQRGRVGRHGHCAGARRCLGGHQMFSVISVKEAPPPSPPAAAAVSRRALPALLMNHSRLFCESAEASASSRVISWRCSRP